MTEQPAVGIPQWDLADRLKKGLRHADMGVAEMADYLDVSRTSVSNWINGRVRPGKQTLRLWALRTGVQLEWLETGTAPTEDDGGGASAVRHQGLEPRTRCSEAFRPDQRIRSLRVA